MGVVQISDLWSLTHQDIICKEAMMAYMVLVLLALELHLLPKLNVSRDTANDRSSHVA